MIIDRRLKGMHCSQLSEKGDAAETLRVIKPPRGLNFKPVTQALLAWFYMPLFSVFACDKVDPKYPFTTFMGGKWK